MKLAKCKICDEEVTFLVKDDFIFNACISKVKDINEYVHVTFLDENNEVLEEQDVIYGKNATNPKNITYSFIKDNFLYTFKGWDSSLNKIKCKTVFKPVYEIEENYYVIKDNTIITTKTKNFHYLIIPTYIYDSRTKKKTVIDSIGSGAFKNNVGLRLIYIPQTIKNMGKNVFLRCQGLSIFLEKDAGKTWDEFSWRPNYYIDIAANMVCKLYPNTKFTDLLFIDGVVYKIENDEAHLLLVIDLNKVNALDDYIVIDDKKYFIASIEHNAFSNATLDHCVLPSNIKYINKMAFKNCLFLNCNIYDNGCYIGTKNNPYLMLVKPVSRSIEQITLHQDVKFIKNAVFNDCHKLKSVIVPKGTTCDTKNIAYLIKK